jgi:hypothetical protein
LPQLSSGPLGNTRSDFPKRKVDMDIVVTYPEYKFTKYFLLLEAMVFTGLIIHITALVLKHAEIYGLQLFHAGIIVLWAFDSIPLLLFLLSIKNVPYRIQAGNSSITLTMFYDLKREFNYSDIRIVKTVGPLKFFRLVSSQNVVYYLYKEMSDLDKFIELVKSKNPECIFDTA